MPKYPQVRKKTKKELANPEWLAKSKRQTEVLTASIAACDRLSKKRREFILDIANDEWMNRLDGPWDSPEFQKEQRGWERERNQFLREAKNPIELHWFSLNWNASRGSGPIRKIVTNPHCDAGTALRLYWLNDPYYYQGYRFIRDCPESEQDWLGILRASERRFRRGDFHTARIPFDPEPWVADTEPEWAVHEIPDVMYQPIMPGKRKRVQS